MPVMLTARKNHNLTAMFTDCITGARKPSLMTVDELPLVVASRTGTTYDGLQRLFVGGMLCIFEVLVNLAKSCARRFFFLAQTL
jgi:hypothetical protein